MGEAREGHPSMQSFTHQTEAISQLNSHYIRRVYPKRHFGLISVLVLRKEIFLRLFSGLVTRCDFLHMRLIFTGEFASNLHQCI